MLHLDRPTRRRISLLVVALSIALGVFFLPCPSTWFTPIEDAHAQQFTFVPHLTPASYQTQDPLLILTVMYQAGPLDAENAGYYSPTYEIVSCQTEYEGICFRICYGGNCYVLQDDNSRVNLFVELVDHRESNISKLEVFRKKT